MRTTCPLCRGSGFATISRTTEDGRVEVLHEDDCPLCDGEGGVEVDPDDDEGSLEDVDVKDED
jgi:hypothetical protein